MLDLFDQRVKNELSKYRTSSLGISDQGTWRGRPYGHILPPYARRCNIIPSIREAFWNSPMRNVKLHADFHHLNSSQGLCFNLFYPYLGSKGYLKMLLDALRVDGYPGDGAAFEYTPDPLEKTSIDFLLPLQSGARVLIEVKYAETSFGSAKKDREHLNKFSLIYRPHFDGRFMPEYEQADAFLDHYQILRNIWHLRGEEGDLAVFLLPRSNEALQRRVKIIRKCTQRVVSRPNPDRLFRGPARRSGEGCGRAPWPKHFIGGVSGEVSLGCYRQTNQCVSSTGLSPYTISEDGHFIRDDASSLHTASKSF